MRTKPKPTGEYKEALVHLLATMAPQEMAASELAARWLPKHPDYRWKLELAHIALEEAGHANLQLRTIDRMDVGIRGQEAMLGNEHNQRAWQRAGQSGQATILGSYDQWEEFVTGFLFMADTMGRVIFEDVLEAGDPWLAPLATKILREENRHANVGIDEFKRLATDPASRDKVHDIVNRGLAEPWFRGRRIEWYRQHGLFKLSPAQRWRRFYDNCVEIVKEAGLKAPAFVPLTD